MILALYLTNKCNVDRGFCYDWIGCHPSKSDDIFDEVPKILDEAKKIKAIDRIAFSGGEPTLYPQKLIDSIKYAKSLGFYVQLKTNGWWGNQAGTVVASLHEAGLDYLRVSYDTARFYPGSPITKAIVRRAAAIGFVGFKDREFAVVVRRGEPDFNELENLKINGESVNVEATPNFNANYRIERDWTAFDPDLGRITTTHLKLRNFRPTIDFKKRIWINTLGLAQLEKGGVQGDYYVGQLGIDTLPVLFQRFQDIVSTL